MRLLYINPNSTVAMTESIAANARQALPPGVEVLAWTNASGPPAVQGPADGAAALPGLLTLLAPAREAGADVIVIACFDDTGLVEMRAAAHCPVLGIGQSAYAMAGLLGRRFSVVTTLDVSVPVITESIRRQGYGDNCAAVRPTGLPVLTVERGGEAVIDRIVQEIKATVLEDGAATAILGCAGMTGLRKAITRRAPLPIIDGVHASARLAMAVAGVAPRRSGQEHPADLSHGHAPDAQIG